MKWLEAPKAVLLGCLLILVSNVALLTAAGWNRRGAAEAELALTERELALPGATQDEGSGLALSLVLAHEPPARVRRAARWKRYELPPFEYSWLDHDKLRELGCLVDLDPAAPDAAERYRYAVPRRVYLVLEYEGSAWEGWIGAREEQVGQLRNRLGGGEAERRELSDAEALLALDRTMRSRLVPIDAALDPASLRELYSDRRRYAVVPGLVRARVAQDDAGAAVVRGKILGLIVRRVHVPHRLRGPLEPLVPTESWREIEARERRQAETGWPFPEASRYSAVLAFGRRHEPRLIDVGN